MHAGAKLVHIRSPYINCQSNPSNLTDVSRSSSAARQVKGILLTLYELVAKAGIKRVELAAPSGVSTASIVRVSHGAHTPKITVIKLIKVLKKYLNRDINIDDIEGLHITR